MSIRYMLGLRKPPARHAATGGVGGNYSLAPRKLSITIRAARRNWPRALLRRERRASPMTSFVTARSVTRRLGWRLLAGQRLKRFANSWRERNTKKISRPQNNISRRALFRRRRGSAPASASRAIVHRPDAMTSADGSSAGPRSLSWKRSRSWAGGSGRRRESDVFLRIARSSATDLNLYTLAAAKTTNPFLCPCPGTRISTDATAWASRCTHRQNYSAAGDYWKTSSAAGQRKRTRMGSTASRAQKLS